MNEPAQNPPPHDPTSSQPSKRRSDASLSGAVALWAIVQFAALVISAGRAPLWARFDQLGEDLALHVMLTVQIAAAALLAPIVAGSWSRAACSIALAIVFIQLAAILSATETAHAALAAMYVTGWLLALTTAVAAAGSSDLARRIIVALAGCLTIGAAALLYARREFSGGETSWSFPSTPELLVSDLGRLREPRPWIFLGLLMIAGVAGIMLRRLHGRRHRNPRRTEQVFHSSE